MQEEMLGKEQILKSNFEILLSKLDYFNKDIKEFINQRDKFLYSLGDNTKIVRNTIEQIVVIFREGTQYKTHLDYISENEVVLKIKTPSGHSKDIKLNEIGKEYFWSIDELIDYIRR